MKKLLLTASAVIIAIMAWSCGESGAPKNDSANLAIENILARKSVRSFAERPVEQEKVDLMLRAGMAAPSAMNRQPWELVVVNDRAMLDKLADGLVYAKMLREAPLAIVVCGDTSANLWVMDCSAVTQNILLAAESLGLGAVWTAAYPYEDRVTAVNDVLGLPENVAPLCVVPIGYPKGEQSAKDKYTESKVHYNGF